MASVAPTAADARAGGTSYGTPAYRNYVLIVLMLVYTLNFVDRNLLAVIAQPVITEFKLSDSAYGFLNGPPFAIFYAICGIPIAMLADRFNRVWVISICVAVWSVMATLCGFATADMFGGAVLFGVPLALLLARVGVAVGEAGGTPPSNSILSDYFRPRSRAKVFGIFAMGVTIGGALSNGFGGPISTSLHGPAMHAFLQSIGLGGLFGDIDWSKVEGWRVAFIVIGAPGLLVALLVALTVKEPPRGFSDPPGVPRVEKANMVETFRELLRKPTFWTMSMGASLTALVGYGLTGFQAPMMQRLHGITPGEFALQFGVPLSLCSAAGTFIGGFLAEKLAPRFSNAVGWLPAAGLLLSIPIYIFVYNLPTAQLGTIGLAAWCVGSACHYSYLGAQYTIGQSIVSQRSRASAIAILLLMIALIGNGLGPQVVGLLSDMFMRMELDAHDATHTLTNAICRARDLSALPVDQQAVCRAAYGVGLKHSMIATALIFIPAAGFFLLSSLTLKKDMLARPV